MLKSIRRYWHRLKASEAGNRFQSYHHRIRAAHAGRSRLLHTLVRLTAGAALALAGTVLLFAPGPGLLLLALGAGLLAAESLAVARVLDWAEVRARTAPRAIRNKWSART